MKHVFNYCLLLIVVFTSHIGVAQSITKTATKHRPITSATDGTENTGQMAVFNEPAASDNPTTVAANTDHANSGFQIGLNAKKNMLNVKTECAGTIYFLTQKGKTKRACLVGEGLSYIFVENMLAPGTYICKFEGINGSIIYATLAYKPDANMILAKIQHKLFPPEKQQENLRR